MLKSGELMNEQELINRVKEGCPKAMDDIVEAYKDPLFAFILRMSQNHSTAEDIFQETWLKVVRYIRDFRGDSKFSTWLFQIALNLFRDAERKRKNLLYEPIEDHIKTLSCDPDVDPIRIIKAGKVRKIVNELPSKMREVIVLRYFHELRDSEIAEIVGCPEGTVKSRCFRASGILRKKWDHLDKNSI